MKVAVLGAGAVGGSIAGLLSNGGHSMTVLARGSHAEAIRADGLRVATPDRVLVADVTVVTDVADVDPDHFDAILLTAKSQDSADILTGLRPTNTPIVCAQNGVRNERIAGERFSEVYGMLVIMPASHLVPGRVDAEGWPHPGILDLGRYPEGESKFSRDFAAALTAANFSANSLPEIMRWKYEKLVRNLGNVVDALFGRDNSSADRRETAETIRRLVRTEGRDCIAAARIDSASADEADRRRSDLVQVRPVEGRRRAGDSTWQSLVRGTSRTEVDYLNGEISDLGRCLGHPTPYNDLLVEEMHRAERDPALLPLDPVDLLARIDSEIGR